MNNNNTSLYTTINSLYSIKCTKHEKTCFSHVSFQSHNSYGTQWLHSLSTQCSQKIRCHNCSRITKYESAQHLSQIWYSLPLEFRSLSLTLIPIWTNSLLHRELRRSANFISRYDVQYWVHRVIVVGKLRYYALRPMQYWISWKNTKFPEYESIDGAHVCVCER
jgi:hypothetical protein